MSVAAHTKRCNTNFVIFFINVFIVLDRKLLQYKQIKKLFTMYFRLLFLHFYHYGMQHTPQFITIEIDDKYK